MAMLLCGKRANAPFFWEKLNIRLYSLEEVCYVIRKYPLIAVDGLVGEAFADWVGTSGLSDALSKELLEGIRGGESSENLLLTVVQTANYLTMGEIRALSETLTRVRSMKPYDRLRLTGKMYYEAGRLSAAFERFREALLEREKALGHSPDELELAIFQADRADILCDMVAVAMLRFDVPGALKLLDSIGSAGRFRRAEEYRYLITGDAFLSEEDKDALREKKRKLEMKARTTGRAKKVKDLSGGDYVKFASYAGSVLREWKQEYRRTV